MIPKLNVVSSLAALVLFLFPWLDIQCSNKSFITQTGIQTIYGAGSASKEMMEGFGMKNDSVNATARKDDSMGISILAAIALIAVVGAVVAAFLILRGSRDVPEDAVGILCAAALVALVIQLMIGFPIQGKLSENMSESTKTQPVAKDPFEGAGAGMAAAMMMNIRVNYLPSFYMELLALGIPTLVLANSVLDKMRKSGGAPP